MDARKIQLESIVVNITHELTRYLVDPKVTVKESIFDDMQEKVVLNVKGFVFGERATQVQALYPANWWQAVRDRWLPLWWLARHPVEMEVLSLSSTAVYNHITEQYSKLERERFGRISVVLDKSRPN